MEFAIVGALLLTVVFAIIELGRALFVMNALAESTRRAVRVAVVCPVEDPAARRAAVFDNGAGESRLVTGLRQEHIVIEYLDVGGGVIANPAAAFGSIRYVRARVENFTHQLIIPMFMTSLPMPGFATTLPRESLGIPREGEVQPC